MAAQFSLRAYVVWAALILALCGGSSSAALANNPGDPLFCQPNEGNTFLITNSGVGVFTADPDCYNNYNPSPPTATTITTSNGGTLTPTVTPSGINYVYTPPSSTFVGIDTFTISVTTSWNSTGGTGSNGGTSTSRPGSASTEVITLNVLSSTVSLTAQKDTPYTVPVPLGSVTGCGPQGNPGAGPPPGTVNGCVTAVSKTSPLGTSAGLSPMHGILTQSGSYADPILVYTPTAGFYGIDSFNFFARGVNTDGPSALSSDPILATVIVKTNIDTLQSSYNASLLATFLNPTFTGGTLALDQPGATYSQAFTLDNSATNTIDLKGNSATFSGVFSDATAGGNLTIANSGSGGSVTFTAANTYTGTTTVNAGAALALSGAGSMATSARLIDNGVFDISAASASASVKSLSGNGAVTLGGNTLILTAANDTFAGTITGNGGLTLSGGTETLTGASTYAGSTTINNGAMLVVNGSITDPTVNSGGVLSGTGSVGTTTVNAGGTLAPGSGAPGTSLMIAGNLVFQAAAMYLVQLNPTTASFANVTGSATLNGATLSANFANGNYISKTYTVLTAAGGVNGTFATTPVLTNLPANFHTSVSYDANDAYLNLTLNFAIPGALNGNQQNVGNALSGFFNRNGGIGQVYASLTAGGLTQASGELGTSSQQTTFDAMTMFTGLLTDPFAGRGNGFNGSNSAAGYAEQDGTSAYASGNRAPAERDAYAMFTKAPPAKAYEPRWSVWASGYGGTQTTSGNALAGSNDTRSSIYGTAVGADYQFSPNTLAGFALAGGGTGFVVANGLGSGRSDLFQAGAYLRHFDGPAYITAALAYGWQDITTDRTVTIAGIDRLHAEFNANAYSGRLEGGYRFIAPVTGGIGITPYAAAQFTTFDLPSYAEQVLGGSGAFALANAGKTVTDTRTELGVRTDKSFAMDDGVLTLRGRLAWAHDYDPDRSISATFQALPGASFVVNGAAQAADSALVTASVEKKWLNGWSAAATFEGEFSDVTNSYAGKGVVRYQW